MNSEALQQNTHNALTSLYPVIEQMDQKSRFVLMNSSLVTSLPPQTSLQTVKGPYQHLFLLLEGSTRAYQCDNSGRELTFYRNYPGSICPLNIQQLFNDSASHPAPDYIVKAETAIHGIQISEKAIQLCMSTSDVFRNYMINQLSNSFNRLTLKLQDTVFNKLDRRLCILLNELFQHGDNIVLNITHQKLANELGTTREVISRSLKTLEQQGCLKITRGKLTMISPERLASNNL